jgi:hypothetical protein
MSKTGMCCPLHRAAPTLFPNLSMQNTINYNEYICIYTNLLLAQMVLVEFKHNFMLIALLLFILSLIPSYSNQWVTKKRRNSSSFGSLMLLTQWVYKSKQIPFDKIYQHWWFLLIVLKC